MHATAPSTAAARLGAAIRAETVASLPHAPMARAALAVRNTGVGDQRSARS